MGQLAQQMGFTLENNGVSGSIRDPYLPGTARAQALAWLMQLESTSYSTMIMGPWRYSEDWIAQRHRPNDIPA